jgi:hypothetical protein
MTLCFHIKVSDGHACGADFVDAIFLYKRMLDILKESHEDILKEITFVNFSWCVTAGESVYANGRL